MTTHDGAGTKATGWKTSLPLFLLAILIINTLMVLPLPALQSGELSWVPFPRGELGLFRFLRFYLIRDQADVYRLSAEFWLMLTFLFLAANGRGRNFTARLSVFAFHLIVFYKIYEAINLLLFGKQPNFYDDSGLLVGAFNLILDIGPRRPLLLLAAFILPAVYFWIIAWLFKLIRYRFARSRGRMTGAILLMGWLFIALCTGWYNGRHLLDKIAVRWISPRIGLNIHESVLRYIHMRAVASGPDEKYYDFKNVRLRKSPPVFFFMLESYGAFITRDKLVAGSYHAKMKTYEERLKIRGFRSATRFSKAPIRGGRSWLSISSVFSGIRIDNQTFYNVFAQKRAGIHHLGKFFQGRGYATVGLQPSNRPRPGVPREDYYDFTLPVFYDQLNYRGSPYGWGIIPDQYSLFYTHDRYLSAVRKPLFLFFMTVTSHAPWRLENLPPYPRDYRALNRPVPKTKAPGEGLSKGVLRALRGHYRSARDDMNAERCALFVMHDMKVLMEYVIRKTPSNALIIILGDHQPAFWTGVPPGDETPIHIISRDKGIMDILAAHDFRPGLSSREISPAALRHEGIYSLIVHTLAKRYGESGSPVPAFRPRGLPISVLRNPAP